MWITILTCLLFLLQACNSFKRSVSTEINRRDVTSAWPHLWVLWTAVPPRTIRTPPGVDRFKVWTVSASSYVTPPTMKTITSCGLSYHRHHRYCQQQQHVAALQSAVWSRPQNRSSRSIESIVWGRSRIELREGSKVESTDRVDRLAVELSWGNGSRLSRLIRCCTYWIQHWWDGQNIGDLLD